MPTKSDLMHYRLQAMMREYNFSDLEYLGERPSYKSGESEHWYSINGHEVPVDAITELDNVEVSDEGDPI
tara:strand:+ start:421 stop:630 length:210 start_codon:yes stop_codon:yes gene_type:complete